MDLHGYRQVCQSQADWWMSLMHTGFWAIILDYNSVEDLNGGKKKKTLIKLSN